MKPQCLKVVPHFLYFMFLWNPLISFFLVLSQFFLHFAVSMATICAITEEEMIPEGSQQRQPKSKQTEED